MAIEAFGPDRLVWGSDWPHTSRTLAWPAEWVRDATMRELILVDTPARRYGFG